eukprot:m.275288 g.275288  ORF g.275288 m.275288 type:complete len:445 (+) comp15694_c0_seq19:335-1669(+)
MVMIDAKDVHGNTALAYSVYYGIVDCVKCLLDGNANPDIPNKEMTTPIHWAAITVNYEILELLLQSNAKINVLDAADPRQSPLDYLLSVADPSGQGAGDEQPDPDKRAMAMACVDMLVSKGGKTGDEMVQDAILCLQRRWRGELKFRQEEKEKRAAASITRLLRRNYAEREAKGLTHRAKAAAKIQAMFRGYKYRQSESRALAQMKQRISAKHKLIALERKQRRRSMDVETLRHELGQGGDRGAIMEQLRFQLSQSALDERQLREARRQVEKEDTQFERKRRMTAIMAPVEEQKSKWLAHYRKKEQQQATKLLRVLPPKAHARAHTQTYAPCTSLCLDDVMPTLFIFLCRNFTVDFQDQQAQAAAMKRQSVTASKLAAAKPLPSQRMKVGMSTAERGALLQKKTLERYTAKHPPFVYRRLGLQAPFQNDQHLLHIQKLAQPKMH